MQLNVDNAVTCLIVIAFCLIWDIFSFDTVKQASVFLRRYPPNFKYRDLLFSRYYLSLLGYLLIFCGIMLSTGTNSILTWLGIALFFVSSIYSWYKLWSK